MSKSSPSSIRRFDADSDRNYTWDLSSYSSIVTNASKMSSALLKKEIERTWYLHIELRTELYEMDMGPLNILEVFVSTQKASRPSMTRDEVAALLESNFRYHMELRQCFCMKNSCSGFDTKETYM